MNYLEEIHRFVSSTLSQSGAHGLDHTMRVVGTCEIIGRREEAVMEILIPAALLHDIARPVEEAQGIPHEEEGARIAEKFLRSITYPEEYINPILHAIRTHRYHSIHPPETQEAMILSDADKLDAMGAVGIGRAFMTAGERRGEMNDAITHIREKLLNLQALMYTSGGRETARERHQFLELFLQRFLCEIDLISEYTDTPSES